MRASRGTWVGVSIGLGLLLVDAGLRAQSRQERQRNEILDELGMKKTPPAPLPEPLPEPPPEESPASGATAKGEPGKSNGGVRPPAPAGPSFTRAIHPMFLATCKACHTAGGPAAATHLVLTGDAAADYRAIVRFATPRAPDASPLLQKASGAVLHGGAAPWPATGAAYGRVLAWIRAGGRLDQAAHEEPAQAEAGRSNHAEPARNAPPVVSSAPPVPPPPSAPVTASPGTPPPAPAPAPPTVKATGPTFATDVHPLLMGVCAACHRTGAPAGMTRLLLTGDPVKDEAVVRPLVDPQAPDESVLLAKAAGQLHGGGAPLPAGDPRRAAIVAWIQSLAEPPPVAAGAPAPVVVRAPPARPSAPAAPPPGAPPPGIGLPLGFFLNGRFDLNYERRQFNGDPFAASSVGALRSYHHFLFLSRDGGDPCGLSVEVLTLLFWEGHCRLPRRLGPVAVTVSGGKIVVPFGADPLFHQSYGGLAGFDQVVLPPVWSIEGVAAHGVLSRGALAFTDDLFVTRGYALQRADSVLNLQNGFSADDATKLAVGNRIGAAWMGVSAWYSAYFNPLGFGRRLFMQAIDVNVWRQRQIPILGHFALGFGLLRADVSGGGPGVGGVGYDYYDFADYLQLRYYPTDWLFLQYRTGLFTFDNRRALLVDNSRLTSADGSTHNFGIVARTRNLWFGIFYFVNLEKVDEVRNDLLRFNVAYEF